MDCEYEAKESHKRGRRVYKFEEQLHKNQIANSFIQKFLVETNGGISQKRKKAIIREDADGMFFGVRYSLNKHGRWMRADAEHLLPGKQKKDFDVAFADHAYSLLHDMEYATSVSFLNEDDTISTEYPKQHTSQYKNLLYNASGKTKKEMTKPRIEYIVHKVHPCPTKLRKEALWRGKRRGRYWYSHSKENLGATNEKYLDERYYCGCIETCPVCHLEPCPWRFGTLESEEEEEDAEKEEKKREYRLNLDECIRQPVIRQRTEKRKRRRENTESGFEVVETKDIEMDCISIDSETSTSPSPLKIAPFRTDSVKKGLFERVLIGTEKWAGRSLEKEVESLSDGQYEVCWLNSDRTRVLIDASRAVMSHQSHTYRTLVVIVEEARDGNKRFTFNSVFPSPTEDDFVELENVLSRTKNLEDFMEKTVKKLRVWKEKFLHPPYTLTLNPSDCLTSRFTRRPYLFSREVNSTMYSERAAVIEQKELDRIIGNLLPSECAASTVDVEESFNKNNTCSNCEAMDDFSLFHANNLLLCWTCLRNSLQRKIGTPFLDEKWSISLQDGIEFSQILPLFFPIPTINDYVNYMVVKYWGTLPFSLPRWINCPCCANLLDTRTNESFNSTLCPICHIVFCANCQQEAHFPMNCEENKKWIEIFDTQVAFHIIDTEDWVRIRFACECGAWIEADMFGDYAKCPGCSIEFNPSTKRLRNPRERNIVKYNRVPEPTPKRYFIFRHNGVIGIRIEQLFEKKMMELAVGCRVERLNVQKRKQFKASVRSLYKGSVPEVTAALDLRNSVLSLIENTVGWLKIHKNSIGEKRKVVKMLKEIKGIYDNLLILLDEKHTNIPSKIDELHKKVLGMEEYLRSLEVLEHYFVFPKNCFASTVVLTFKEEGRSCDGTENLSFVGAKFD